MEVDKSKLSKKKLKKMNPLSVAELKQVLNSICFVLLLAWFFKPELKPWFFAEIAETAIFRGLDYFAAFLSSAKYTVTY